jgi:cytochrome c biogenesis protein CcdA
MGDQNNRAFSNVFQEIVHNTQSILRSEIHLAKTEVKEEATKTARAMGIFAAGVLLAFYAAGFLFLTIERVLGLAVAAWVASLIVAISVGVGALLLIQTGRTRIKQLHATPDKTIQTMKENVEWVKNQIK